jgi:hypothetical protein
VFDSSVFPRAAEYFGQLPGGLDSYPMCRARAEVVEAAWRQYGETVRGRGVPPPLEGLFAGEYPGQEWIPEVYAQLTNLMIRDVAFETDEAYFEWSDDVTAALFDRPVFRAMMRMMPPKVIVMGATKRWGVFHEGSVLAATAFGGARAQSVNATVKLTFPGTLFSQLYLETLTGSFRVILEGVRAKDPTVRLSGVTPGEATYELTWQQ